MGVFTAIAIGAAATAAAAAYSAVEHKKASDKASDAQKTAVKSQEKLLKKLDPDTLNSLANKFDKSRAQNRIALQKEIDPEVAQLREISKKALLDRAQTPLADRQSNKLATELYKVAEKEDPRMTALKDSIIANAQAELAAGASLPPEFQQELVRAGLETGGQSGIGFSRNAIGGGTARLLGAAGVQLQQARQDQALQLAGAAQAMTDSRVNILSAVFPRLRELEAADRNESLANLQLAEAMLPEAGLSGREAVNIQIGKSKAKGALIQKRADIKGQEAAAQADYNSSLAQTGANFVGTLAGGYAGYAGGAGGGTGSGGMGSYMQYIPQQNVNTTPAGGNNFQQRAWGSLSGY
jgi:hypothetical protein